MIRQKIAATALAGASATGLLLGFTAEVHANEEPGPATTWIDAGMMEDGTPVAEAERARAECKRWVTGYTGHSKCWGNAGATARHRALVTCIRPNGTKFVVHGEWKRIKNAQTSSAVCSPHGEAGVYKVITDRSHHG